MTEEQATALISELYDELWPTLVQYGWRLSSSTQLAEDCVQESFLDLYETLRKGESIGNPKAWLIVVVRRKLMKLIRRHSATASEAEAVAVLDRRAAAFPPAAAAVLSPQELLDALSAREQEVVMLRLSAMKYREIGKHLGISAKTVSVLLTRAIRKLRIRAGVRPEANTAWERQSDGDDRTETLQ